MVEDSIDATDALVSDGSNVAGVQGRAKYKLRKQKHKWQMLVVFAVPMVKSSEFSSAVRFNYMYPCCGNGINSEV